MVLSILKYGISEGLAKLAPFLTTLYVAKYLSPELFGKYSLIVVLFEVIFIFVSFNIQATTRIDYFKETKKKFNLIKQNHIAISLLIAGICVLSVVFLPKSEQLIAIVLIFSALFRTGSVFILAIFQCSKKVNLYILSNITFVVILSLSVIVFLKLGYSYYSWLYGMLTASGIQFLLTLKLYGATSFLSFWPKKVTFRSLKWAFASAVLFMPQAIGWWFKSGADRFLINKYLGLELLGNYSLAFQLSSILIIFTTIVNLAVLPFINENLHKRNIVIVFKTLTLVAIFATLFAIALYFTSVGILNYFYKQQYAPAQGMIAYLCISNLFQAFIMIFINVLYYEGRGKYVAKLVFISFFLQFLINYLLLSHFKMSVNAIIISSLFFNIAVLVGILRNINDIFPFVHGVKNADK